MIEVNRRFRRFAQIFRLMRDEVDNNTAHVGIMSRDGYKKRTIAIVQGEYEPAENEPKVWVESAESLTQILSGKNQDLLKMVETRLSDE